MKFFHKSKDGGPESTVLGYWLAEIKNMFSVVLLKFEGRSREAYHTHAFNCISWVLKGQLIEHNFDGEVKVYKPSLKPVITRKSTFHKVDSIGNTWVFSLRGPWEKSWIEYLPGKDKTIILGNGRHIVSEK